MEESLVKVCSDEVAHAKFKQLYGERPKATNHSTKMAGLRYDQQRVAFYLAWESSKKVVKERVEVEIAQFFEEVDSEGVWYNVNGEKYISMRYLVELRV